MAQQLEPEFTLVDTPSTEEEIDVILPTPTPRGTRQEETGAMDDQQVELDQLFDQTERACSFEEYRQVLQFCSDKERKDLATVSNNKQTNKQTNRLALPPF